MEFGPSEFTFASFVYRRGSYGKGSSVFFNWKVLQLPTAVIDYVVAHELVHLVEHNHGPELWRILDRSLPDWRARRDEFEAKAREIYCVRVSLSK